MNPKSEIGDGSLGVFCCLGRALIGHISRDICLTSLIIRSRCRSRNKLAIEDVVQHGMLGSPSGLAL
jgi:hypothetical protein